MNEILLVTSALLAAVSGYLGFRLYESIHPKPTPPPCPISYDYSTDKSEGIINYETAEALYKNYQNDRGKAFISKGDKLDGFIQDANSVWFSLDRLKNFLWHIEEQNCKKPCRDTLGLRIYFGKYPDLNNLTNKSLLGLDGVPKNYSNRHTLFMVPTYKGKDGYDYDFYPGGKGCQTPITKSPLLERKEGDEGQSFVTFHAPSSFIFFFDKSGVPTSENSQNHGGLVPPNPPTGTSFNQ
jgi:hypothetical protein